MESLPLEMVAQIAHHLTARDLAHCCAVSIRWREIFGCEHLWQPLCDPDIAEYLKVAQPLVEPHFSPPIEKDSTLSDLGEWRLSYMREAHLWNNWRLRRFKEQSMDEIEGKHKASLEIFYANDYILGCRQNKLELWDFQKVPQAHKLYTFKKKLFGGLRLFEVKGTDKILVIEKLLVRVFKLDLKNKNLTLLHAFSMEESEKYSTITESFLLSVVEKQQALIVFNKLAVFGNVLVGVSSIKDTFQMHIWDVELGQKLKEETLPSKAKIVPKNLCYCEKSKTILVDFFEAVTQHVTPKTYVHFSIYSLNQMAFMPFRTSLPVFQNVIDGFTRAYDCAMDNQFLAARVDELLYIYNYHTSEMVFTSPCTNEIRCLSSKFVFLNLNMRTPIVRELTVVNPVTRLIEAQVVVNAENVYCIGVMCDKIIFSEEIDFHSCRISISTSSIWARNGIETCDDHENIYSFPLYLLISTRATVNKAATKLILGGCGRPTSKAVLTFW